MSLDPATLAIASLAASAASTAVGVVGAVQAGKAAKNEADYRAGVARNNQILAMRAADEARKKGDLEANMKRQESLQLQGRQRALLAGAGVQVDIGSAGALVQDTAAVGELDALTIRSNAEREALGFEAQGSNFEASARLSELSGKNAQTSSYFQAGSSLLSGFGSVSGKWATFKHEGVL